MGHAMVSLYGHRCGHPFGLFRFDPEGFRIFDCLRIQKGFCIFWVHIQKGFRNLGFIQKGFRIFGYYLRILHTSTVFAFTPRRQNTAPNHGGLCIADNASNSQAAQNIVASRSKYHITTQSRLPVSASPLSTTDQSATVVCWWKVEIVHWGFRSGYCHTLNLLRNISATLQSTNKRHNCTY